MFLLVEGGHALCGADVAGILVNAYGMRREVVRKPSVPLEELAREVPEEFREVFLEKGWLLYRTGNVPAAVAVRWRELVRTEERAHPADTFEYGLSAAVESDAWKLQDACRASCGAHTFEHTWTDSTGTHRRWWRKACGSHRCQHCAKRLGLHMQERIVAQLGRDESAGRSPAVFMTVTVDRTRYRKEVEAQRNFVEIERTFIRLLRARFEKGLAKFSVIESHAAGWPHGHLLLRSPGLVRAMLEDAGIPVIGGNITAAWAELVAACKLAREVPKGKRRKCPYAHLRQELNQLAVDAGFGRMGFWFDPVRNAEDAARYLTEEQTNAREDSQVAEELTKARQIPTFIPRHFRRFRPSGKAGSGKQSAFFTDENRPEAPQLTTETLAMIHARIEDVRERYMALGVPIAGEVLRADMRGDRPIAGAAWPRELEGFAEAGVASPPSGVLELLPPADLPGVEPPELPPPDNPPGNLL